MLNSVVRLGSEVTFVDHANPLAWRGRLECSSKPDGNGDENGCQGWSGKHPAVALRACRRQAASPSMTVRMGIEAAVRGRGIDRIEKFDLFAVKQQQIHQLRVQP